MQKFEYRVIAAPNRGVKAKGINSAEARFSHALEEMMNSMASEGWEYQRAETLPSVERAGLTSTTTTWRNVLIFRRAIPHQNTQVIEQPENAVLADPSRMHAATQESDLKTDDESATKSPPIVPPMYPEDDASQSEGASRMLQDNGVEELSEVSGVSSSLLQLAMNRKNSKTTD